MATLAEKRRERWLPSARDRMGHPVYLDVGLNKYDRVGVERRWRVEYRGPSGEFYMNTPVTRRALSRREALGLLAGQGKLERFDRADVIPSHDFRETGKRVNADYWVGAAGTKDEGRYFALVARAGLASDEAVASGKASRVGKPHGGRKLPKKQWRVDARRDGRWAHVGVARTATQLAALVEMGRRQKLSAFGVDDGGEMVAPSIDRRWFHCVHSRTQIAMFRVMRDTASAPESETKYYSANEAHRFGMSGETTGRKAAPPGGFGPEDGYGGFVAAKRGRGGLGSTMGEAMEFRAEWAAAKASVAAGEQGLSRRTRALAMMPESDAALPFSERGVALRGFEWAVDKEDAAAASRAARDAPRSFL